MKKTLILLLAAVMMFSAFAGCAKGDVSQNAGDATSQETTEATGQGDQMLQNPDATEATGGESLQDPGQTGDDAQQEEMIPGETGSQIQTDPDNYMPDDSNLTGQDSAGQQTPGETEGLSEEEQLAMDEYYAQMQQELAMQNGGDVGGYMDDSALFPSDPFEDTQTNTTPSTSIFSVGYAKADITPSLSLTLPLIGNNDEKTRVATGVLEKLYATCTAITDESGTTVILFGMDAHGIPTELLNGVRNGIKKELGIDGKYVQMTGSHTHQAPPLSTNGYGYSDSTTHMNNVIKKCVKIAKEAMDDRKSAAMYTAYTRVDGINFCRYTMLVDGTHMGSHKSSSDAKYYSNAEKSDNLLQMVMFDREEDTDVLLANWQAHYRGNPSDKYTLYSSDYMGVMRNIMLEQANCETVFILGASGNLASRTDVPDSNSEKNADYKAVGQNLATSAIAALHSKSPAKSNKIHLQEKVFNISTNSNDYTLSAFGIGDVGFCMMPYEPFQSLGIKVREESPYAMTLIGTCANGNGGNFYLPDAKAYGAENAYGVSKKYVSGDEQKFHKQYISMLKKCFKAADVASTQKSFDYQHDSGPYKDPNYYTNPSNLTQVKNGLYRLDVRKNGISAVLLVSSEKLAKELLGKTSFKVMVDTRSIAVGIQ